MINKVFSRQDIYALSLLALRNKVPDQYKNTAENGFCATYVYDENRNCLVMCLVCLSKFEIQEDKTEWNQHLLSHLKDIKAFL